MSSNKGKSKYQEIKNWCLANGRLYEDPDFPAVPRSVYFSKTDPSIQWKRPIELCSNPMFTDENASRFDLDQGELGNCWYIAAAATLATRPELFKRVVPGNQSFGTDYSGLFRFNFWCYGTWTEVLVDDRLPTRRGTLVFCSNREHPDEFWSALLEKAYAKMVGSYEAMDGGWTEDALVDFTGGIGQRIDLTKTKNPDFFKFLLNQNNMSTLMGCSINATRDTMENELRNGLVIGHAYSITSIKQFLMNSRPQQLLRLRNPWGRKEWNGAWSDRSREWQSLDPKTRQELGIVIKEDGEFWISFQDWLQNFHQLQLCHLPPGVKLQDHNEWREIIYHGSWVKGVNAGGSGHQTNPDLYWTNSQYSIILNGEAESRDSLSRERAGKQNVVIVSLMQKGARRTRTTNRVQMAEAAITFDVYKAKSDKLPPTLTNTHYDQHALRIEKRGGQYQYYREISDCLNLDDGTYVVIPSTYEPYVEGDYILRVYTDGWADSTEMDIPTAPIQKIRASSNTIEQLFSRYSGNDGVIDSRELQMLLNEAFKQELGTNNQFDLETCRGLVSMLDKNRSGVMELAELRRIWTEVTTWREVFRQFDRDSSGYIESSELKGIFKSVGFTMSRSVLKAIVRRYCGKQCKLTFNDFVLVLTKVATIVEIFPDLCKDGLQGKAELSLDALLELVLYF